MEAAASLVDGKLAVAERLLREHLKQSPADVAAIRMLAEVAARLGRLADSETLLTRCLELAPSFLAARYNLAVVLNRGQKYVPALAELNTVLEQAPRHPGYRNLKAAILCRIGGQEEAIDIYADILAEYQGNAHVWMSYGHTLKTANRQEQSIAAYRRSLELMPELGEAWWSLANLKTFRFTPADVAAMRTQLARNDLRDEDRFHFDFALGKALEDAQEYAASFEHYSRGNALRRSGVPYDRERTADHVRRSKALLTDEFFAERKGCGCPAPDPIFIVGLPRSGSTLLEQILSSHPLVEGTQELPDMIAIAGRLGGKKKRSDVSKYPEILATLPAAETRALGEEYLERTRVQRKTDAPFFIDKMPNNWLHVGLIHLILPNARIVDARRHPLGCCFSVYKQHFARGQHFSYSLEDIGAYYRKYVELAAHFDKALPGRVHRVFYEEMVEDTAAQVRRLLDYCGLPFDERCLRFHENERAVRTASSEQVRQPIYRDAVEHWRHYEAWLDPLKQALGPVLTAYPAVPDFED